LPAIGSSTSAATPGGIPAWRTRSSRRPSTTGESESSSRTTASRDPRSGSGSLGRWRQTGTTSSLPPTAVSAGSSTAARSVCPGSGGISCPWRQGPTRRHGCTPTGAAPATSARAGPPMERG
jgi:hypothetical protein